MTSISVDVLSLKVKSEHEYQPLSLIFTNKLNPSEDFNPSRLVMLMQKSLEFVLESTSNA